MMRDRNPSAQNLAGAQGTVCISDAMLREAHNLTRVRLVL